MITSPHFLRVFAEQTLSGSAKTRRKWGEVIIPCVRWRNPPQVTGDSTSREAAGPAFLARTPSTGKQLNSKVRIRVKDGQKCRKKGRSSLILTMAEVFIVFATFGKKGHEHDSIFPASCALVSLSFSFHNVHLQRQKSKKINFTQKKNNPIRKFNPITKKSSVPQGIIEQFPCEKTLDST
jgi:hypothetical protein